MKRIFVPRLVDTTQTNAQNLNAKALLSRFGDERIQWSTMHYGGPDPAVLGNPRVKLRRLWRRHFWPWHMVLNYQRQWDAIFYPGLEWMDESALNLRQRIGRRVPVIATFEGLVGDKAREQRLSACAGHPVYCHYAGPQTIERIDRILGQADHIIAISPFLARMGQVLYGDKFSVLPLGIDRNLFSPPLDRTINAKPVVVSAGTVYERKRPELFIELAGRFQDAQFVWYGEGMMRSALLNQIARLGLTNCSFPGAQQPRQLAGCFRGADVFVLPSLSEGWGKVTQEAAACGLPCVVFGNYETPLVQDGQNGYTVWSDSQFFERVGGLIEDRAKARVMGQRGAEMAKDLEWDQVAPLWEKILHAMVV